MTELEGHNTKWLRSDTQSGEGAAALDLPAAVDKSAVARGPARSCPGAPQTSGWHAEIDSVSKRGSEVG